jgi:hypothetical protein
VDDCVLEAVSSPHLCDCTLYLVSVESSRRSGYKLSSSQLGRGRHVRRSRQQHGRVDCVSVSLGRF